MGNFLRQLAAHMLSINVGSLVLPSRLRPPAAKSSHHPRRQTPVAFLPRGGQVLAQLPPSPAWQWLPLRGTKKMPHWARRRWHVEFVRKAAEIKPHRSWRTPRFDGFMATFADMARTNLGNTAWRDTHGLDRDDSPCSKRGPDNVEFVCMNT